MALYQIRGKSNQWSLERNRTLRIHFMELHGAADTIVDSMAERATKLVKRT